ncbi:efflux RND transporter periplasmic adaptor subunit [Novipirellula caenicola]|uniref:CusB-like beta-barrel domain-containing protein n=1 Tax=Novipirellula caenicola TaxID=1536901 RepID=A0ABP9W102_9BACT
MPVKPPNQPYVSTSLAGDSGPLRDHERSSSQNDGGAFVNSTNAAGLIDDRLRVLSVAIELQLQLDSRANLNEAADDVANQLGQTLAASRVYVAWRPVGADNDATHPMQIVGQYPSRDSSRETESDRLLTAAIDEIAMRGDWSHWPIHDHTNRHSLMAVSQFVNAADVHRLTAVCLSDDDGDIRGVLLVLDDDVDRSVTTQLMDVLRFPVLSKFQSIERSTPSWLERLVRRIAELGDRVRGPIALYAAIVIGGIMCFPVHYHVRCDCELQPIARRYLASPIDGPLEKTFVRPGDRVSEGDLVARIDAREIEYKLAGLRAEWSGAKQQRNRHVVQHDFAASKIAELESDRLKLEMDLLEYHRGNLEIRSPIDGIVVSGDHHESVGAPLQQGDTLFEIAPLGEMMVEVAVDEREFPYVDSGMPVQVTLHALPGHPVEGKIQRVHPQAELKNHQNVFIAESKIQDPENVMRPGMRGHAWVKSDRHPLGWVLFHRLYASLRSMIGW